MSTFAFLMDNLAETPESELRKVVSVLWKNRLDIVDIGDRRSIGNEIGWKISLHRISPFEFVFLVSGVVSGDDTKTISRIFEETMNDAP